MNAASPAPRDLIEVGRGGVERVPQSLSDETAWQAFNNGPDSWVALAAALHDDEVEHLIRGLILYGRASGRYHHGAASPVTWLFRMFRMNRPELEAGLGAWVVANRVNPYDPFGVLDDGQAHTLAECKERERVRLRAGLDGQSVAVR